MAVMVMMAPGDGDYSHKPITIANALLEFQIQKLEPSIPLNLQNDRITRLGIVQRLTQGRDGGNRRAIHSVNHVSWMQLSPEKGRSGGPRSHDDAARSAQILNHLGDFRGDLDSDNTELGDDVLFRLHQIRESLWVVIAFDHRD